MTVSLCKAVEQARAQGLPVVLASIIAQSGSTPRTAGTRMLVYPDRTLWGTVGGGEFEGKAVAEAGKMHAAMAEGDVPNAKVLRFSLHGISDMDMICGGDLTLFLEPLFPQSSACAVFRKAYELEATGLSFAFVSRLHFSHDTGEPVEFLRGILAEKEEEVWSEHERLPLPPVVDITVRSELHQYNQPLVMLENDGFYWLIEPFAAAPRIFIFGAGHVALYTAQLAALVGFQAVVFDDRAEFSNKERFPEAKVVVLQDYTETTLQECLSQSGPGDRDAVVVMTRGHAHDRDVLKASLKCKAGYLGMIGSRRKREQVYADLMREGVAEEELARVHSPIGLPILAETPEEIAVSILAEIIQWRRTR